MKYKIIIGVLAISVMLNLLMIYLFFYRGEVVKQAPDNRIVIKMSKENREYIMAEMRGFLESVHNIHEGITENDFERIAKVGKESGICKKENVPVGLLRTLPIEFKEMGMNTHKLFDEIARNAKENQNKEIAQKKLSRILNHCIACHRMYQITALN